jgi:hypothetical protein
VGFVAQAIVLLALLVLAYWRSPQNAGMTPLSPMQMIYVFLSIELVVAVYLWGVGNWSRFEPPRIPTGFGTPLAAGAAQPQPPAGTSPAAVRGSVSPPGPKGGG